MAPEFAPAVVVFDARLDGGKFKGSVEYIEPRPPATRVRVRWAGQAGGDFTPIRGGVAFFHTTSGDPSVASISDDAAPDYLGDERYRWTEGLNAGAEWVMFILILPVSRTISQASPPPAGVRLFGERVALYWVLQVDKNGRTHVTWKANTLDGDLQRELIRLNKMVVSPAAEAPGVEMESDNSARANSSQRQLHRWPFAFWTGAAVLVFLALVLVFGRGIDCDQRGVFVAFIAIAAALAFGFFGRSAELGGSLPPILGGPETLRLSLAGGAAVFGLVLLYGGRSMFGQNWDQCSTPVQHPLVISVRDAMSKMPVADARVSLKAAGATYTERSDSFGQADFAEGSKWRGQSLPANVSASNYQSLSTSLEVPATGGVTIDLTPTDNPVPTELPAVSFSSTIIRFETAKLEIVNRGPGAAVIRDIHYFVDGKPIEISHVVNERLKPLLEKVDLYWHWVRFQHLGDDFRLADGKTEWLFEVPEKDLDPERLEAFKDGMKRVSLAACYCSASGQCAVTTFNSPPDYGECKPASSRDSR